MSDFEDPTQLARCIKSDCQAYRAGSTPLCAAHLREQEVQAGATSIVEPEVEAAAKAAGDRAMRMIGQDPDTQTLDPADYPEVITQMHRPDPTTMEPHWDGNQWVLKEKTGATFPCPHCGGEINVHG